MNSSIIFTVDEAHLSCYIMKIYLYDVAAVWSHFSNSALLDQWWAPKPWKCETQYFDFCSGGKWNFALVGPDGEKFYAGVNYNEITTHRMIAMTDFATDAHGNLQHDIPMVNWLIGFTGISEGTKLTVNLFFNSAADLHATLEMGFEAGFRTQLNQLEDILSEKTEGCF